MRELYIIPERQCIKESVQLSREYQAHFEYNDFFLPSVLDDEEKIKELIDLYKGLDRDRSKDTLHGAFLDVTIHSEDERIRKVSELRVRQCMDIAAELGIRGVIFHTNIVPNFRVPSYLQHWTDSNESFWKQILGEYPELEIFIENMFDETPDLLAGLAERMKDEARFGICLDYAHALAFGNADAITDWVKKLLPYVHHMHINDNDLHEDLHQIVGEGSIDWSQYDQFLRKQEDMECSVLVEVRGIEKQRKSLEFMKRKEIYPF